MIERNDATQAQVDAARPMVSTWLSANAGSGKTRVLTDRVARLLLAQVPPERILCLTYTKAAASEMQNRLFKRLGEWAMLENSKLKAQLQQLGEEGDIGEETLRKARRLFAAAIEAPGGLKIQTIHSFCATILRRFPLEAGVSPQFSEMEDHAADLLRNEILEDIASGPDARLIYDLARAHQFDDLSTLTAEIAGHRSALSEPVGEADIFAAFGVEQDLTVKDIAARVLLGDEERIIADLMPVLQSSGTNDLRVHKLLAPIDRFDESCLENLEAALLTQTGKPKTGKIPVKKLQETYPHMEQLNQLIERVAEARELRLGLLAAQKTILLHQFAGAFLSRYAARKQALGWLDFDDLILKTRDLLKDSRVADWVLYRLDGGIDHILVDEAQDTSPEQWEVIECLSAELTSGHGARDSVPRTIFVVGDKKQSIYSFQGADPNEFDRMHDQFAERLRPTNTPLEPAELQFSFRSAQCILDLVDHTFEGRESAGFNQSSTHKAFENGPPGRVDLWPVIDVAKDDKNDREWTDTLDHLGETNHAVVMARRIADQIKHMIGADGSAGEAIFDEGRFRKVRAGDVLILVQRRSDLFHEIIRACKEAGLPIAGSDRLKVGAELAVRDMQALLRFLATQEDDLSLAEVLKSPLFGWREKQLFDLAQGRGNTYLWQKLREQKDTYSDVIAVLDDLRRQADFLRPYDLIDRVLTRHCGRKKILGRLGREAEDGIDALLSQALAFERSRIPSLTGFLAWMESDDLTIKRQHGQKRDEIRVMTVHGSKGLEAPIVIMPETQKRKAGRQSALVDLGGIVTWNLSENTAPDAIMAAKAEAAEKSAEERMRLLYVAMTRAEKWLILGAAGDLGKEPHESWYGMVEAAAKKRGGQSYDFGFGQGLRIEPEPWSEIEKSEDDGTAVEPSAPLETYFQDSAVMPVAAEAPLSPSDLGGAKALPSEKGLDEEAAKARGTMIHALLEHLPNFDQVDWHAVAEAVLPDGADREGLLAEVGRVVDAPELRFIFAEETLAEVPVVAELAGLGGRKISGIIDRLSVGTDDIWAIDFKTNVAVPDMPKNCPEGLLRQMGAYEEALAQIYPNKNIRMAIVWTANASLMELPHELVTAALHRAGDAVSLDVDTPNT